MIGDICVEVKVESAVVFAGLAQLVINIAIVRANMILMIFFMIHLFGVGIDSIRFF
jgi:hypothetical protein